MLQDLSFGRLENEFHIVTPQHGDRVACIRDGGILLRAGENHMLSFPSYETVRAWAGAEQWTHWNGEQFRYVFRMQDVNYFLWMGEAGEPEEEGFFYENARQLRYLESKDACFAAMTAWHLYHWYRNNRFCGRCGTPTVHDSVERMVRCPACGNLIFPRISPAVIVAITDGDRLLLSKYAGRAFTRYALIAGYTEIGETIEQTVQREVMEEVGLRVKNIRYFDSQPWGIDGNVLMGFFCDLDGDNTIHLDERELALAEWHHRSALPAHDDGITLTRAMIGAFEAGKEPKAHRI